MTWQPAPEPVNRTDQVCGETRVLLAPTKNARRRVMLVRGEVQFFETIEQAKEAADA